VDVESVDPVAVPAPLSPQPAANAISDAPNVIHRSVFPIRPPHASIIP